MSETDLRTMEGFLEALENRDLERVLALTGPDLVVHEGAGLPWGGEHHGPDGFQKLMVSIFTDYDLVMTNARLSDAGGFIVAQMVLTLTSRATGAVESMPVVELYELRDGLIRHIDAYYKDTKAVFDLHAGIGRES